MNVWCFSAARSLQVERWGIKVVLYQYGLEQEHQYSSTNFANTPRGLGHPGAMLPRNPSEEVVWPWFRGRAPKFLTPTSLRGFKTHNPPDGLWTQKLRSCAIFLLHSESQAIYRQKALDLESYVARIIDKKKTVSKCSQYSEAEEMTERLVEQRKG